MIKALTGEELLRIVPGKSVQSGSSGVVDDVVTDSRKIIGGGRSIFIGMQGAKSDGHEFIPLAYQSGVRSFIVEEGHLPQAALPGANVLVVADALRALQSIGQWNRSFFTGPVVGITGSNGKTIVKEWLGQMLGTQYNVAKSPKSYNSQSGVPLSLLGIQSYHKVALIEAGISEVGEMEILERMIQPSIGLFTNLGTAHDEGFADKKQKLEEKIKLFSESRLIIYRKDQHEVAKYLESKFSPDRLVSWSSVPGADYTLSVKKGAGQAKILLMQPDLSLHTFQTHFTGEASLENLRHVIVACLTLGMDAKAINTAINGLRPIEMRLTLKQGVHNCTLIDDTYNNDLAGLEVALEFLQNQRPKRRKILILSDLLQAGEDAKVYEQVARLVRHYQIDFVYGVGEAIRQLQPYFPDQSIFYADTASLLAAIQLEDFSNDLILIKGARKFEFEQIVNYLQERIHGTSLEINLNALGHNYSWYKNRLQPGTKIMAMVKAFAYGGGSLEIANQLQQLKADYLAVAYTDEGVFLRNHGIHLPIMVLNPEREGFRNLLKYKLDPVVYSVEFFDQVGRFCQAQDAWLNIHLDMDTGMHRLGFEREHMEELKQLILRYPLLKISSVYTHLAGADDAAHREFTLGQLEAFSEMSDEIRSLVDYPILLHALNSAGILQYPDSQMDMVRLGIGLYGIEVAGLFGKALRPISNLKTAISQIKNLPKGQTVGYGRKGQMAEDGRIATIPIGYADGYDRRFSNGKGYVAIHGKKAPIIGNVCMDMCMVDITGIDARVGDEVIVYGEFPSVIDLAQVIGTIPYELLTNISERVKRVYYLD